MRSCLSNTKMKNIALIVPIVGLLFTGTAAYPSSVDIDDKPDPDDVLSEGLSPEEINKKYEIYENIFRDENEKDVDIFNSSTQTIDATNTLRVSYEGSQLWRVVAETDDKKKIIGKLRNNKDISMWGGNQTSFDVLVKKGSKDIVQKQLHKNSINFDVIIENVQRAIDEENPLSDSEDEGLELRQGHRMTWHAYHRMQDIHGYLDYLAQTYPKLCTVYTIGSSVQGRPLKLLKISNGNSRNKAIWVDGGVHAREWISPATVTYIINNLVLNIDSEPKYIQDIDWYILPVANPDGYEYSHTVDRLWRKNRARSGQCAGTDLNRNFGHKWGGKGSGRYPCQEIYAGNYAFSEPETAAIRDFITGRNANWNGYVSFHSYGQYILFPWGYDRLVTEDYNDLLAVAQKAAQAIQQTGGLSYTVGPAGSTLYPAAGGSDDWAKGAVGMKYAYTIELRDSGRYGFVLPATYILPTAKESLAALRVIAEAVYSS